MPSASRKYSTSTLNCFYAKESDNLPEKLQIHVQLTSPIPPPHLASLHLTPQPTTPPDFKPLTFPTIYSSRKRYTCRNMISIMLQPTMWSADLRTCSQFLPATCADLHQNSSLRARAKAQSSSAKKSRCKCLHKSHRQMRSTSGTLMHYLLRQQPPPACHDVWTPR